MRRSFVLLAAIAASCSQSSSPPPSAEASPAPPAPDILAPPPAAATSCDAASLAMDRNTIVARVDGKAIRASDLGDDAIEAERGALETYCRDVQRIRTTAVDRAVDELVLGNAAARQQTDIGGYLRDHMSKVVGDPSDEDVEAFYRDNKTDDAPPLELVRDQVVGVMKDERAKDAYRELLESLRTDAKVEVTLPDVRPGAIEIPIPAHTPTFGPADAPVTIVEFSDFECPYCAQAVPAVAHVKKQYGDQVRFAFRHFPLSFHHNARPAAAISQCAAEQNEFWSMHDAIFEHSDLSGEGLRKVATKVGLDPTQLEACLASDRPETAIEADIAAGMKIGVQGTPSFYINGRAYDGAISGPALAAAIEQELASRRQG